MLPLSLFSDRITGRVLVGVGCFALTGGFWYVVNRLGLIKVAVVVTGMLVILL